MLPQNDGLFRKFTDRLQKTEWERQCVRTFKEYLAVR